MPSNVVRQHVLFSRSAVLLLPCPNFMSFSLSTPCGTGKWGKMLIENRGGPGADGWVLHNFEPEDRRHLTILQLAGGRHAALPCACVLHCPYQH